MDYFNQNYTDMFLQLNYVIERYLKVFMIDKYLNLNLYSNLKQTYVNWK